MLLCPPPSRFGSQPRPRRPIASRHMRSWALSKLMRNTDSQFVLYRPQGRIVAPYYVLPPSLSFSSISENGRLLLPKRPHAHTHTLPVCVILSAIAYSCSLLCSPPFALLLFFFR